MSTLVRKILQERFIISESIHKDYHEEYHCPYCGDNHFKREGEYCSKCKENHVQKVHVHDENSNDIRDPLTYKKIHEMKLDINESFASSFELDEELVPPAYTKLKSQAEDQSNAADESYRTSEHHHAAELHVAAAKHAKGEIRKQQHINKALYHFEAARHC